MALRVLILEDDESVAATVQSMLGAAGYSVEWCETADATLRTAAASPPDVVILDHMLPGKVSGAEVARRMRRRAATRDTPILLLTAMNDPYARAVGSGVDAVMAKPFHMRDLLTTIEHIIAQRGDGYGCRE